MILKFATQVKDTHILLLIYKEKKALKQEGAKSIIFGWKFKVTFLL